MASDDPLCAALEAMIPHAVVRGGSLLNRLPPIHTIAPDSIQTLIRPVRETFLEQEIGSALGALGVERSRPVGRLANGARDWPKGIVGSITHKGAIALVAVASRANYTALGIDLEHSDANMSGVRSLVASEGLPAEWGTDEGTLAVFSAKEAAFKAIHRPHDPKLPFSGLSLSWGAATKLRVNARCLEHPDLHIGVTRLGRWLISSAVRPAACEKTAH